MTRVAVIYFSATGTTTRLAEVVAAGAGGAAAEVVLQRIVGTDIIAGRYRNEATLAAVDAADAVIFGSPTFMGGPAAEFKAFADASSDRWTAQRWAGKLAAGFTCGSNPNGDQAATLAYLSILAGQHGMLWCGVDIAAGEDPAGRNRLGVSQGTCAHVAGGELVAADIETARYLGERVAVLAGRFVRTLESIA